MKVKGIIKGLTALTLLAVVAVTTSCSKDDDDVFTIDGQYNGTYSDERLGSFNEPTTIVSNGDGTYNLIAPAFSLVGREEGESLDYGAMTLKNIKLEETADGGYNISGDYSGVKIWYSWNEATRKSPSVLEFSAHLKGTLSSTGKLDYTLDLNHANTVLFYFTFNGNK